jgi:hypothetical protein
MMEIRSRKDFVAGGLMALAGASFAWVATGYRLGAAADMGPGYFPFGLGLLLAIIGVVVFVRALAPSRDKDTVQPLDLRVLAWVFGSIGLFAVVLTTLGLIVSIFILVILSNRASHERHLGHALIAAGLLALLCVGTFVYALELPIRVWPSFLGWG